MDNKNKIESIHFLVDELERYNRAYYVDCKPLVRDYDYDEMLKTLEKLENEIKKFLVSRRQ